MLICKMSKYGLEELTARWVHNWMDWAQKILISALIPGLWPIISRGYPGSIPGSLFFNILINNLDDNVECATNKLTDDTELGEWLTQEIVELRSVVHLRTEVGETSRSSTKKSAKFCIWKKKTSFKMSWRLTGPVVRLGMSQQLLLRWCEYVNILSYYEQGKLCPLGTL